MMFGKSVVVSAIVAVFCLASSTVAQPPVMYYKYFPQVVKDAVNKGAKREDANLIDTQYSLPGLTRFIKYFVHAILQDSVSLTPAIAIEFAQLIMVILPDVESHVTRVRIDKAYRASKILGKALQLLPTRINKRSNRRGYSSIKGNYSKKINLQPSESQNNSSTNPTSQRSESSSEPNSSDFRNTRSRPFDQQRQKKRTDKQQAENFCELEILYTGVSNGYLFTGLEQVEEPIVPSTVELDTVVSMNTPDDVKKITRHYSLLVRRGGLSQVGRWFDSWLLQTLFVAVPDRYSMLKETGIDESVVNFMNLAEYGTNENAQLSADTDRRY
ncbi:hypothetical protein BB560_000069 [Smittium megazygosporum]|uniref:Uncharacterized protein n=1 Tax=Smittium megazygosporum TaxID=133381 RepID=A0A2T9ZLK7_9FUNG|nr:hypothetical protein BB560_000069 [Smittium megazygosporum]